MTTAPAPEDVITKVASIENICCDFGVPLAAAALQFPLAHPAVASVIPGIGNVRRIDQTLQLFATDIPDELWNTLADQDLIRSDAPIPSAGKGTDD